MWHKKGVSPLIATVLLIAFAVALGATVMSWGRGYVTETTEAATENAGAELACGTHVDVGFVGISGVRQVCYNSTVPSVEFLIENRKHIKIYDFHCQVIGQSSRVPYTAPALDESGNPAGLAESGSNLLHCDLDPSIGAPKQFRLIPSLSVGGRIQQCHIASVEISDMPLCENII